MGLFNAKPQIESKNYGKAEKALKRVVSEFELKQIVLNDNVLDSIQQQAFDRIKLPKILREVVNASILRPRGCEDRKLNFWGYKALLRLGDKESLLEAAEWLNSPNDYNNFGKEILQRIESLPEKLTHKEIEYLCYNVANALGDWDYRSRRSPAYGKLISLPDFCSLVKPYINETFVQYHLNEYCNLLAESSSSAGEVYLPALDHLRTFISNDLIIKASAKIDADLRKEIFRHFKIIDEGLIASGCDIGEHEFEFVRDSHDSDGEGTYHERHYDVKIYKCKHCGEEKKEYMMTSEYRD